MQVKLDNEVIFEIDDRMVKLLAHDLLDPIGEIKRRLRYIIEHKCDQSYERMKAEYMPKFEVDPSITTIPSKKTTLADFIMAHPSYKNRSQREKNDISTDSQ